MGLHGGQPRQVGAAIFYELDYRCEARNADDFAESLRMLDFVKVPATVHEFTGRRTLVQVRRAPGGADFKLVSSMPSCLT
jgi:hypothetical protein